MVSRSFITALALLGGVEAHTRMVEIFRNGEGQGEAAGIRMDLNGDSTTGPVTDLSSTDMACGRNGETPVGRTVKLAAGDGIVMSHRSWADGAQPGVIDSNHKGSTAVYLKKIADAGAADPWATTAASGDGWFKISWNGLDTATRQWGVDVMINNGGYTGAILPRDLDEGYYLVRDEVLGLQNRDGGGIVPQFFVGCAQVYIAGGSGGQSPETVSIPGHVSASSPSLTYDIYKEPWGEFPEFGPAVYAPIVPTSALKLNQLSAANNVAGTCPEGTVLTVGNKCFTELPTWSDDTPGALPKCWAASAACWEKNTDCWDNVEPVINGNDKSKGCSLWEAKCNNLDAWCEAGNTNGPPDAGKVISEPLDLSGL